MRKIVAILLLVIGLTVFGIWGRQKILGQKMTPRQYRFAKVEKRDLANRVSATGTLSAVITVEVGSEISGQIIALLADFNSQVRKGDIIARLAPDIYQALVREAEAELTLNRARLLTQKAAVERCQADIQSTLAKLASARAQIRKTRASLDNALGEFERNRPLLAKGIISKALYDAGKTAVSETRAQLEQSEAEEAAAASQVASSRASLSMALAQVKEAEAQIDLKKATLDKRRVDLDNTIIRSPVDGVVIDRSVDVGQTVAASLQAPTLFTIAQDLSRMQVTTSVDEADIGRVREGQPAYFTVDAFGNRRFSGQVTQIRKAGKTVQNVVTYTVIVSAENSDLHLMPGMTASVEIEILNKQQVLAVANAALHFNPSRAGRSEAGRVDASADAGVEGEAPKRRADPEERLRRLRQSLDLTQAQQDSLRKAFQETGRKMRDARQSGELGPGGSSALRDKVRKETQTAIMKVLTPEQRIRYARLSEERKEKRVQQGTVWRLNPEHVPVGMPVTVGVSDGSYTEISGKDLEPGMEMIIGTLK